MKAYRSPFGNFMRILLSDLLLATAALLVGWYGRGLKEKAQPKEERIFVRTISFPMDSSYIDRNGHIKFTIEAVK